MGFEYFQEEPFERFKVPDQTEPLAACIALLAFAAYPHISQLTQRRRATDAFHAWICRAAIESGIKIKPPVRLTRKELPPAPMRRRVYMASRRIEFEAIDLVGLGMDITFFRSGGPLDVARLLGGYFQAKSVSVRLPRNLDDDARFLREHLKFRRAKSALDKEDTLKDFRRRVWKIYLPALPLLTAIHVDCLKFDFHKHTYSVTVPGYGRRYLAITLLRNPQLWIDAVVLNATIRREMMIDHFPPNTFAEILGERELPPWISAIREPGSRSLPPDNAHRD